MDTIEEISISRIASILTNNTILTTGGNSVWDRILSKAGQSNLVTTYGHTLKPYSYNGNYENENRQFGEFFSSINSILKQVYNKGNNLDAFVKLVGSIVEELDIEQVLNEDTRELQPYFNPDRVSKQLRDKTAIEVQEFIKMNAKKEFTELQYNLQVLNMDISYEGGQFVLSTFTNQGAKELERNTSILLKWLNERKPEIALQYNEALKNYIDGNAISCISTCRNIIVGIFDSSKEDTTKWLKGLQRLSTDTYIDKVQTPSQIINNKANRELGVTNVEFKFSRFKTIYQIYSLASDLGAHILEGPMIDGVQHLEKATMTDALWILRMTEDILIWVKETSNTAVADSAPTYT